MRKLLLMTALMAVVQGAFAQNNCSIKRAYAFYKVHMPGILRKGEDGRNIEPNPYIERTLYLENSGTKAPVVEMVTYNGIAYKPVISRINSNVVSAGKQFSNNEHDFLIKASNGNSLWMVELQPVLETSAAKAGCRNIVVRSKLSGKNCKYYLYKENELATMPAY